MAHHSQNESSQDVQNPFGAFATLLGLGFFSVVCQTLLFRQFLAAFEGNELGVGAFFGAWLLWVAIGAVAARFLIRGKRDDAPLFRRFHLIVLVYIPVFLVQSTLTIHARALSGVQSYEMFPFFRMASAAFLINAPFSFCTGAFFTIACAWVSRTHALPVARVYIIETLGAFAGGVSATLLLGFGVRSESTALVASAVLSLLVAVSGIVTDKHGAESRSRFRFEALAPWLILSAFAGTLLLGLGMRWATYNDRVAWAQLLPGDEYEGSFSTAQAVYLYGERKGQFVVMSFGGVCEALPDEDHASEVVALHLAQHPDARRVLLIGADSLAIGLRFLAVPQIEDVTWLHPDPEYAKQVLAVLPETFKAEAERLTIVQTDARSFLREKQNAFDLALLNLPDATTLVLNRYLTLEFYERLRTAMAPKGVASVRVSGPANYISDETAYIGSSIVRTLEKVFGSVVLKPGDETWIMASNTQVSQGESAGITESPAKLRDRFLAIPGAAAIYPPEAIMALYPADRIAFQREAYRRTLEKAGDALLINTDVQPKALLYNLVSAFRRAAGVSLAVGLPAVLRRGGAIILLAPLMYLLFRFVYSRRSRSAGGRRPATFDTQFLIFVSGLVAMSLSIVLMFVYQSRFGSLFVDVGLVTSLFMLGSFLGGMLSEYTARRNPFGSDLFLAACVVANLIPVALIFVLPAETPRGYCMFLFMLCGVFGGIYIPLAAQRMQVAGQTAGTAGANLEMFDHVGGAAGAVMTGLALLPLFGVRGTLEALYLAVAVSGLMVWSSNRAPSVDSSEESGTAFDRAAHIIGYTMFGLAAFLLVASQILSSAHAGDDRERLVAAARTMTDPKELREKSAQLADGTFLPYFAIEENAGFIFSTGKLVAGVAGYGGPIDLAVSIDGDGALRSLRILQSNETPAYVERARPWMETLAGRNLFAEEAFKGIDGVSGATLTSAAVIETVQAASRRFAAEALGRDLGAPKAGLDARAVSARRRLWMPDRNSACLAALAILAIFIRYRPNQWLRRVFLLAVLVLAGLWLNLQYSSQQVMSLMSLRLPALRLDAPFFLVIMTPIIVLLFANIYCGYLCPFGALQELIGDLRPSSMAADPDKPRWTYGRFVKYVLLFLLVALFALTRDFATLSADPLITVLGSARDRLVVGFALVVLALSFFYRRFFCRNLCPAGAFLALVNGVKLLRRLVPATQPARCDLGVRESSELDCIHCDRCRISRGEVVDGRARRESSDRIFIGGVLACAIVLASVSLSQAARQIRINSAAVNVAGSAGQPRNVDIEQIKALIREGVLSGKEAEFYTKEPGALPIGDTPGVVPSPPSMQIDTSPTVK